MKNLSKVPCVNFVVEFGSNQWKSLDFRFILLFLLISRPQQYKSIIGNASFTLVIHLLSKFFIRFLQRIDVFSLKDFLYMLQMSVYYILIENRVINTR